VNRISHKLRPRRALTPRERRMLLLAGLLAAIFALGTVLPALQAGWQQRQAEIVRLRDALEREQRLVAEAERWQQRRADIDQRRAALDSEVFAATTVPLLSAAIQQQVRQLAAGTGTQITAASLAESRQSEGWLLVEQRLDFTLASQSNLPELLQRLDEARPRLDLRHFSLRHGRNQYSGQLTVVGFARLEEDG
jgi:hypothetical protein